MPHIHTYKFEALLNYLTKYEAANGSGEDYYLWRSTKNSHKAFQQRPISCEKAITYQVKDTRLRKITNYGV